MATEAEGQAVTSAELLGAEQDTQLDDWGFLSGNEDAFHLDGAHIAQSHRGRA